jgi:O-acetyl-ADP-ribose deacetylase (regulator of RNase III)
MAGKERIRLVKGDITEMDTDAIVNAANAHLKMGGGVAGAILRKGGQVIQDECDEFGFIGVGNAAITTGGNLKAKYVIHAVGPRMGEGNEDEKLASATFNALKIAAGKHFKAIAFPAISTGIFGYPIDSCAAVMLRETVNFFRSHEEPEEVIFCLFDDKSLEIFQHALDKIP